jgi:hypothetical protein
VAPVVLAVAVLLQQAPKKASTRPSNVIRLRLVVVANPPPLLLRASMKMCRFNGPCLRV